MYEAQSDEDEEDEEVETPHTRVEGTGRLGNTSAAALATPRGGDHNGSLQLTAIQRPDSPTEAKRGQLDGTT
jgi:hypothetical protein